MILMQVKEIMSKNPVSVGPDDHVSKALSKMENRRIHQVLVMSGDTLYGMLELKKIVSRDMDVTSAKVENFATNVPNIDANASVESAAQLLLNSALRAVPVTEAGKVVGIVSEADLMKIAKQFVAGLSQPVEQIATEAVCIGKSGNYANIKRLIFDKNISRVPIVDENKVLGIVGTLELIKILKGKETMETHGGTKEKAEKEKLRLGETLATAIMRPAVVVSKDKTIKDAIELLQKHEEILILNGDVKIVTHKDIMELFAQAPQKSLYVQITGMQDESIEFKVKMDSAVTEFVRKISKLADIEYLVVHIEKMRKQGPKEKYSIRARFKAPVGFFVAHAWGWKPIDVAQEVFGDLEREIIHKQGKIRARVKKGRFLRKGR